MKHTRLALSFIATTMLATSAFAASMTMLQFGSFETRAEAEKRLGEVTKKHSAEINKLPTAAREVKLPPDNLTVYRTQAGPVESRAVAQSICAKLAGAGDECYIVQTAMVKAEDMKVAASAPAPAPIEKTVAEVKADVAKAAAEPAASEAKPDVTSKLSSLKTESVRDSASREALTSVTSNMAPSAAPVTNIPTPPADEPSSAAMNSALDKAVADGASTEKAVNAETKQAVTKQPSRSFWSRLNPFSDDEPVKQAAAPEAPKPIAAPVEEVAAAPLPAPQPESSLKADELAAAAPAASAAAKVEALPAPTLPSAVVPAASPEVAVAAAAPKQVKFDNAPVITQAPSMQLPPPPAPLKARDREMLTAASTKAAPESLSTVPAAGSVQVEEAKRVPVTNATATPEITQAPLAKLPAPQLPAAATPMPAMQKMPQLQPDVPLSPSATNGVRTVWAQIGPFANSDEALAFWVNYRQANPDFPVVRVRTASGYQQQLKGIDRTWLRVGPVTREAFVKSLCNGIDPKTKLRCGLVADLGVSSPSAKARAGAGPRYRR